MLFLLLSVVSLLLIYVYLHGKYNENYWKGRGVTFHNENKILGVFWDLITKDEALFETLSKIYKKYSHEPAVGIGGLFTPNLFVLDPVNIQNVLATDFNSFNHRGFEGNEGDLLADNLLFQTGKKWKIVRQSMTPLFTSTKIKSMYYILDKSAQDFVTFLKDNPEMKNGDTFKLLSTFCSAAIGAAVFGINTNSIFDSPFLKMTQESFRPSFLTNLQFAVGSLSLPLFKFLGIKVFKNQEAFFIGAIKQVLRQREIEKTKKHDFADLCVSLQSSGTLKDESGMEIQPTDELLAAQAFFFFTAGVEPTASVMYAVLMELGRYPDVLKQVHKEIDQAFENNNEKITYDVVSNLQYLEMVINECMRLNPAIGFLTRQCVQDTYLPVGNIKVEAGTKIFVPVFDLHHNEKYYPEPEKFDPERFSKDNKNKIMEAAFLPFGKGKRICVGMRYAQYQVKAGLIHLLRHFTVETKIPETGLTYKKNVIQVRIKNAVIRLFERN